jgi:hypothetical protein
VFSSIHLTLKETQRTDLIGTDFLEAPPQTRWGGAQS